MSKYNKDNEKGRFSSLKLCHILAFHNDIGMKDGPLSLLSLKCASNGLQSSTCRGPTLYTIIISRSQIWADGAPQGGSQGLGLISGAYMYISLDFGRTGVK